jgi:acetyltransferase-like isoleucine patch superfamily enzyme
VTLPQTIGYFMHDTENNNTPKLFSWDSVRHTFITPWKARNEIERLLLTPFAWLRWRLAGVTIADGWQCYGLPIIQKHRDSTLTIGANANFRSTVRSNPLGVNHACMLSTWTQGAVLTIGAEFGMTGGSIVCAERVTIGNRVFMGANTIITDTDFHPLSPAIRNANPADGKTAPVTIEDDVFIGMQVLILKGVTLGAGSVIGAGSVVTRDIPAGMIAAGNPAQVIRPVE